MEIKEAFAMVATVCVAHKATLSEHQRIQAALKVIQEKLFPTIPKAEEDEEQSG